jgi:hypothetical protein
MLDEIKEKLAPNNTFFYTKHPPPPFSNVLLLRPLGELLGFERN